MATVYKSVGGKQIEKVIALNEGVQAELDDILFTMVAAADLELLKHTDTGASQIESSRGKVDRYITLSDERGQKAALSIEYGRKPSINPDTGATIAGMDGLFILHKATHLKGAMRGKVKVT